MIKYLSIISILVLAGCAGTQTSTENDLQNGLSSVIAPPFQGDFSNSVVFNINPAIENTLETPNGSSFTIPANILVNENGELITDEVTVKFDQYHSAVDILASGIPMEYDTLGETFTFKSAGMFSLNANANDKPVFVKEGEEIAMNLASDKGEDEPFNFYTLNENTGDWTFEHSDSPITLNPKFDPQNYLPAKPEPVSDNAFVLDINFDHSSYDELKVFSGIVWEYTGDNDSLDPRLSSAFKNNRITDIELTPTYECGYEYFMTFKTNSGPFTTRVKAALSGEDFDLAMKTFEAKKVEISKKLDNLQKPYVRSVSIEGFGTYNYDYYYKFPNVSRIVADFNFGKSNDLKDQAMVAVVYENDAAVLNYPKENWQLFNLNPDGDPKIIAILPNNQLAVYQENVNNCFDKTSHTFNMTVLDKKVESKADIIDALANL